MTESWDKDLLSIFLTFLAAKAIDTIQPMGNCE